MSKNTFQRIFDVQSPIFRPLWLRIVIVAFTSCWTVFEAISGNTIWALIFGVAATYLAHQFFIAFDPPDTDDDA